MPYLCQAPRSVFRQGIEKALALLAAAKLRLAALEKGAYPFVAILGCVQEPHRRALRFDPRLEAAVLRDIDQQLGASDSHRRRFEQLARPQGRPPPALDPPAQFR